MVTQTIKGIVKHFESPDEIRDFEHGRIEIVHLEDVTFARAVLKPGWKWSEHIRPLAQTDSCMLSHLQYVISGRLKVRMDDGTEMDLRAGDCASILPGHDAWVVGSEPFVAIDFLGLKDYAQARQG